MLPQSALRLATEVSLHDGLLRRAHCSSHSLELLIRAGDQQRGYFDARLFYGDASVHPDDARFVEASAGRRDIELLYDEFDSETERRWVHRILFWPYHEVSVTFATLDLHLAPAPGRFTGDTA
jgi:hypothetical protein